MKLNLPALAFASAVLWGLAVFITGIFNIAYPGYADAFLKVIASVYPGYSASGSLADLIVGTVYAIFDGIIGGLVFGWLYNIVAGRAIRIM